MQLFNYNYFLKIKYTANTKNPKPIRWFILSVSFLNANKVKMLKTTNVITSCMTFNCHRLKGPPFSTNPILFAGTCTEYSKNAMPQLMSITENKLSPLNQENSLCSIFKSSKFSNYSFFPVCQFSIVNYQ